MPNGHDKNFIRLCAALEGFRIRFGKWPIYVRTFPGSLQNLRSLFSPEDFATIESKVRLVAAEEPFVAGDEEGNLYSYGSEGFPQRDPTIRAQVWLGVLPVRDE